MPEDIRLDQSSTQLIYAAVRQVPKGKVASYGQIARIVGMGIGARQVGYAMAALRDGSDVPWQRIINSKGMISLPGVGGAMQKKLLVEEGVEFDEKDRVDMKRFGWNGPNADEDLPLFKLLE
jgi:methylated-DNA-protein-cysteine methyltransferase-like protein